MKSKLINDDTQRTFVLVFETGDEVIAGLETFAKEQQLAASQFTGLGALSDAVLGFFDWEKKDYRHIPVREQVEVASLVGDVTLGKNGPKVHPHIMLSKSDGSAIGGHLLKAHVRPTLEVVLTESPAHLHRKHDPDSGLALIDF